MPQRRVTHSKRKLWLIPIVLIALSIGFVRHLGGHFLPQSFTLQTQNAQTTPIIDHGLPNASSAQSIAAADPMHHHSSIRRQQHLALVASEALFTLHSSTLALSTLNAMARMKHDDLSQKDHQALIALLSPLIARLKENDRPTDLIIAQTLDQIDNTLQKERAIQHAKDSKFNRPMAHPLIQITHINHRSPTHSQITSTPWIDVQSAYHDLKRQFDHHTTSDLTPEIHRLEQALSHLPQSSEIDTLQNALHTLTKLNQPSDRAQMVAILTFIQSH